jgi:hypothetical protein
MLLVDCCFAVEPRRRLNNRSIVEEFVVRNTAQLFAAPINSKSVAVSLNVLPSASSRIPVNSGVFLAEAVALMTFLQASYILFLSTLNFIAFPFVALIYPANKSNNVY